MGFQLPLSSTTKTISFYRPTSCPCKQLHLTHFDFLDQTGINYLEHQAGFVLKEVFRREVHPMRNFLHMYALLRTHFAKSLKNKIRFSTEVLVFLSQIFTN